MFATLARLLLVIPFAVGLMAASGCASKPKIDATSSESIIGGVNKGDRVRITTKNDVVHKFTVSRITNKALYGDNERITYEDMQKVEVTGKGKDGDKDAKEKEGGFFSKLF